MRILPLVYGTSGVIFQTFHHLTRVFLVLPHNLKSPLISLKWLFPSRVVWGTVYM